MITYPGCGFPTPRTKKYPRAKPPITPSPAPAQRARNSERFTGYLLKRPSAGPPYQCAGPHRCRKCGRGCLRQCPDLDHLEAGMPSGFGAGRNQCAREPVAGRLLEAALELADAAHLPRQPQLTDANPGVRQGPVVVVADVRQGESEISGRLLHPDASRDAYEYVRITKLVRESLLQHRKNHVQAVDDDAI